MVSPTANLATVTNPDVALDFERIVYGDDAGPDESTARRRFQLFLILNLVQTDWFLKEEGILPEERFKQLALNHLSLIARHQKTIEYLVEQRDYSKEFAQEVKTLLRKTKPPIPVPPLKEPTRAAKAGV